MKKRTCSEGVFRDNNREVFVEFDRITATGNFDKDGFRTKVLGLKHFKSN